MRHLIAKSTVITKVTAEEPPVKCGARSLHYLILCIAMFSGLSLFHNYALGQVSTGTVNGVITDPEGNLVVGATVTVKNADTHVFSTAVTNSLGSFQVQSLIVGQYEVRIEATGFKTFVATNVRIEAGSVVNLDERLITGTVASTVEVVANGTQIETEKVAFSTTLNEKLVQDTAVVPATGSFRDSTLLINLTPGASGSFFGVNIAGGRAFAQEVEVDGVPQLYNPVNTIVLTVHPSFDVIKEVYVQPGVPAAEYGRSSGGAVTELTRSGTSQYHGDASVFFRNTALDARAYNSPSVPTDHQYELPLAIGGPVIVPHLYDGRERTFFFFNWDHFWNKVGNPNFYTVPTLAERTGDFSAELAQGQVLYNPATQVNGVRQPFPNNQITPISAIAQAAISLYPAPTNGALTNNYFYSSPTGRTEEHYFGRVDHNITQKHTLHATLRWDTFNGNQPNGIFQNNTFDNVVKTLNPQYDWLVNQNLLNHFSASVIYYGIVNTASNIKSNAPILTVPGVYGTGATSIVQEPLFSPTGYSSIFAPVNNITGNTTWEYDDTLTWTKGKHNLRFGERFNAFEANTDNFQNREGSFGFSPQETGVGPNQTGANSGNAIASFLLGYVDNANTQLLTSAYQRSKYFGIFAQDSWRLTPTLTVNYGLRWEMQTPFHDAKGNMTYLNPNLPNAAAGGLPGALVFAGKGTGRTGSNTFISSWKGGYSPRIGLAYDMDHNTVLRAGYGILYAPYEGTYDQTGFSGNSSVVSPDGGYTSAFTLDNGFPATSLVSVPQISPTLANNQAPVLLDTRNGKSNRLQDNQIWQLDIQRTFGSLYLDFGYVGEVGHHIAGGGNPNYNQVNPKYLALGSLLTQPINSPAVIAAGYSSPYSGFSGSLAQALRPFPQFTSVSANNYPSGSSSWNGLLIKAQKQYSNGFTFLLAYTWLKEFSNVGFYQFGYNSTQDTYNSKGQKTIGDNDIPQNLQLSYVYDLPFGTNKRFLNHGLVSRLVEGFGVSGLHSYQSGLPIHINPSVPGLPIFNNQLFVNIVPGARQTLSTRGQTIKYNGLYDLAGTAHGTKYLNADAFANPAPYTLGNSRYYLDHVHQLAVLNENFALWKRTHFTETTYVELRAEMFNAFNRQNFSGLDTNLADNTPNGHFGEYTSEYSNQSFGIQPGPRITEIVVKFVF